MSKNGQKFTNTQVTGELLAIIKVRVKIFNNNNHMIAASLKATQVSKIECYSNNTSLKISRP